MLAGALACIFLQVESRRFVCAIGGEAVAVDIPAVSYTKPAYLVRYNISYFTLEGVLGFCCRDRDLV